MQEQRTKLIQSPLRETSDIDYKNPDVRDERFQDVRAALGKSAVAQGKCASYSGMNSYETAKYHKEHAEETVKFVGTFAGDLVPELTYHAALVHDMFARAFDPENKDLQDANLEALYQYFDTLDEKGARYVKSILADTIFVQNYAKTQRRDYYDGSWRKYFGDNEELLTADEISCLTNGGNVVSERLWQVEPPAINLRKMLELAENTNFESIMINACEVIEHLHSRHPNEDDAGLLREIIEAESLYGPLCEVWGLDAMAMTLRSLALKRRIEKKEQYGLLSDDEQEAVDAAREAGDMAQQYGGSRAAILRLFGEEVCEEKFYVCPTRDDKILAEVCEFEVDIDGKKVRTIGRMKSDGSRMNKYLKKAKKGIDGLVTMDDMAFTMVVDSIDDVAQIYTKVANIVADLEYTEFKSADSKEHPLYVQGDERFKCVVQDEVVAHTELSDSLQVDEKEKPYQVAKMTFMLDGIPTEIQFLTVEGREDARVGLTAHILYKLQQDESDKLSPEEITKILKAIRSRKYKVPKDAVDINGQSMPRMRMADGLMRFLLGPRSTD